MSKPAKAQGRTKTDGPRQHFCPQCDKSAKPVMRVPKNVISFMCENYHETKKGSTILR